MIPKEFTIGGITYSVKIYNNTSEIDDNLGDFSSILKEIRLAKNTMVNNMDVVISDDILEETYWHELGHCFGNYYNDDHSEEIASAFSHFMVEYFKYLKK